MANCFFASLLWAAGIVETGDDCPGGKRHSRRAFLIRLLQQAEALVLGLFFLEECTLPTPCQVLRAVCCLAPSSRDRWDKCHH
jgi:hypothetical protein